MAQQIEPIEIFGKENKGEYLRVYKPFPFSQTNLLVADILDKKGDSLFSTKLIAKNLDEVAQQLNLKLLH